MADIADRFANLEIGPAPEPAAAPEPEPVPEPVPEPAPLPTLPPLAEVADTPSPIEVPEAGVAPGNAVATQDNPPPWVLPNLPALGEWGDWRSRVTPEEEEVLSGWRVVEDLPSIWQPAPPTLTNQLWQEYVGRGYRDHSDNLPDVGQQIAAGLPSVSQTRNTLLRGQAPTQASQPSGFSLPSFDLFGGLFDGLAGLGALLDGLIGMFALTWLFGPSQAPAVDLILYAVPLELGVLVHNALVNRGVRATAVEFAVADGEVMEEFFFNVPEPQTWLAENIMMKMKVMWRKVDE